MKDVTEQRADEGRRREGEAAGSAIHQHNEARLILS